MSTVHPCGRSALPRLNCLPRSALQSRYILDHCFAMGDLLVNDDRVAIRAACAYYDDIWAFSAAKPFQIEAEQMPAPRHCPTVCILIGASTNDIGTIKFYSIGRGQGQCCRRV